MHIHARLTMYGLLSEMELDLRNLITSQVDPGASADEILGPDLAARCRGRFAKEHGTGVATLLRLVSFADLGDIEQVLQRRLNDLSQLAAKLVRSIRGRFGPIIPIRNRVMHNRPINFSDLPTILAFTDQLTTDAPSIFPYLIAERERQTADPAYVLSKSLPSSHGDDECFNNLPFPDFEETGFLGREDELKTLRNSLLKSAYPVISVLGSGGLGKTAIALRLANDLLEDPDNPFKAIIWSTSKSTQLTHHDIREIENTIRSSAELLQHTSRTLAGLDGDDPAAEIHEYMREFPVLLVLDNLENVIDDRLRNFLQGMPIGRSRVIITSRIGLQAMDLPFTLKPFDASVDLLRLLATNRGVEKLTKAKNAQLDVFCTRLHRNPLAIKWFVTAVQNGLRPEDVLGEQGLLLDYCMSNVYEHLSTDSKIILSIFQILGKTFGFPKLVAISGLEAEDVGAAILQLDGANMITSSPAASGSTYETSFSINHLALAFLNKHHMVSVTTRNHVTHRLKQFQAAVEEVRGEAQSDPYSIRCIRARNENEAFVASILLSAIDSSRKLTAEAQGHSLSLVRRAKSLAREYYEVHRVEGYILYISTQVGEAVSAYEAAVELNPSSAPLRLWFGQLLLREGNLSDAETQFEAALKLEPNEVRIRLETARLRLYQQRFNDARAILTPILADTITSVGETYARMAHDMNVQSHVREAQCFLKSRQPSSAVPSLLQAKIAFEGVPAALRDVKILKHALKAFTSARKCEVNLRGTPQSDQVSEIIEWLETVQLQLSTIEAAALEREGRSLIGQEFPAVVARVPGDTYGFLKVISRQRVNDVYFTFAHLPIPIRRQIRMGLPVYFTLQSDPVSGIHAENIRLRDTPSEQSDAGA